MLKKLTLLLSLTSALAAIAQSTTITASHINYFGGQPVTGQFCLQPTDQNGHKINLVTPVGQQLTSGPAVGPVCWTINNGVLASNAIVPDTSLTQPVNACYQVVIYNILQQQIGAYSCIQPQGSSWSFDSYVPSTLPSITALTLPQFQTNGAANQSQGVLNIVCAGCTNTGGTVNIPGGGSSTIANNTVLGNVSGAAAAAAALTVSQLSTLLGSAFDAAGAASTVQSASLQKSSNLGDLASAATARTNLGLGTAATSNTGAFDSAGAASTVQSASLQKSSNLGDLASAATARTNLGLGTAATSNTGAFDSAGSASAAQAAAIAASDAAGAAATVQAASLQKGNNLSDLASASTARSNLGLGTAATSNTGAFDSAGAAATAQTAAIAAIPANTTAFANAQTAPAFYPQIVTAGPYVNFFDDYMLGGTYGSSTIGSATGAGCGVTSTAVGADNNSAGYIQLVSGTGGSGTGVYCSGTGVLALVHNAATAGSWTWASRVYVLALPSTTAASYQAGLTSTVNVSPFTNGIGFYLSSANGVVNDWYCRYSSTQTDSGVAAVAATWTRLAFASDGTYVHWYINGTEAAGCRTAISSMPTGVLSYDYTAVAGSTTTVYFDVDYTAFQMPVTR